MSAAFWGITIAAGRCKKAEIPEGCELELTNVALQNGKRAVFYAKVDEEPEVCVAILDAETNPQHSFSLVIRVGSAVKLSNKGDGEISVIGCQRIIDDDEDDEEIPSDYEDEDDEDDEDDDEEEDDEDEDDDDDEDEEEEEQPKKPVKRPEPKMEKKVEKPSKQQKPAQQDKKPEKKVESSNGFRCELCKRNFNTEKALEQHNAAKHGKK